MRGRRPSFHRAHSGDALSSTAADLRAQSQKPARVIVAAPVSTSCATQQVAGLASRTLAIDEASMPT
jgi:hypothetical protein